MPKTKTKKNKKPNVFKVILNLLATLIVLCLVLVPVALCFLLLFNSPVLSDDDVRITGIDGISYAENGGYYFDVRRGETSQSVGNRLESAGLIKNRHFWNLLCRLEKEHIKTGRYIIELPATQLNILRLLVSGKEILHSVTIPEGVTIRKAAKILEDAGFCAAEEFIYAASDPAILRHYNIPNSTMEGYLFPDTYSFPKEFPAHKIVEIMADNFYSKIESISPSLKRMSPAELDRIVVLASVIEREYRVAEEAPLIAGVFYNRLRINMRLQSCATVQYIITEIQGKPHPTVLLFRDLEVVNPYNTYMYAGLPPGPISAPGYISLRAAVYPETTNFFYFRLTDAASGRHYFSRTHDEHIRAGQLYIKPAWQ